VRTWGIVVASTGDYFTISDGGRDVRVTSTLAPPVGKMATVTGISGGYDSGAGFLPVVLPRSIADVQVLP
jgi:hypothetical protein